MKRYRKTETNNKIRKKVKKGIGTKKDGKIQKNGNKGKEERRREGKTIGYKRIKKTKKDEENRDEKLISMKKDRKEERSMEEGKEQSAREEGK